MLGRSRSEVVGHNQSEFFAKPLAALEPAREGKSSSQAVEVGELKMANGKTIPVQIHTSRLTLYGRPLLIRLCHEIRV